MSAVLFLEVLAVGAMAGFVAGSVYGIHRLHQAQEAIFGVRLWLVRFRPALDGWLAMHPVCDNCDAELFALEATIDALPPALASPRVER